MTKKILNIAHRGASGISPENTLPAFEKAIEFGADIIELDVQFTLDRVIVVIHDEKITKYTGINERVKYIEFNTLKTYDFGSWFSPEFKDTKILSLEDVFDKFRGRIKFNIEIKKGEKFYPGITESVLALVYNYNLSDDVMISSFDLKTIKKLREIDKNISAGIIFEKSEWYYYLRSAEKLNCQFIVPEKTLCSQNDIENAHQLGFAVYPYVTDEENEFIKLINMGVDGIITNRPDRLNKLISELDTV